MGPIAIRTRCKRETICAVPLTSTAPCSSSLQSISVDRTVGFPSKLPYSVLWKSSPGFESKDFLPYISFSTVSHYTAISNFDVLLTVHLSIFILVINQLDAQNFCFTISFISCLYMFRAPCSHHKEVKIVLYSLWYHHTYRCDDTRGCIIQF